MKLHYITIGWDNYWNQIVVGHGEYTIHKGFHGVTLWKRLLGIPAPKHKEE